MRAGECLILSYAGSSADSLPYASSIVLLAGRARGNVQSRGFAADANRFWRRMRQYGGLWRPLGADSIEISFLYRATAMSYRLAVGDERLSGQALIRLDTTVQSEPDLALTVSALRLPCPARRSEAEY